MDWVKTGWGYNLDQTPRDNQSFIMDFSAAQFTGAHPLIAAKNAIHRIMKNYPPPYTLMCSGGTDSQAMAYAWLNFGENFQVVSFKYNTDMNEHDICVLQEFSQIHNFSVKYLDIDVIKFLESSEYINDYAIKYQIASPQICTYIKMSEQITEGTVIFSGNFLNFGNACLNYTIYGLHRYAKQTNRSLIGFFFQHDPELSVSFIPWLTKNGVNFTKDEIYIANGFPVISRQKYSGFEKIKEYYDKFPNLITFRDRLEFGNQISKRIFDLHFRYKLRRVIKYEDKTRIICKDLNILS